MAPKAKAQKMSLGAFLEDQALGSWADEMEDVPVSSESRTGYGNDRRVFTQPSERSFDRGSDRYTPREQLPLPSKPPYTAHLGNLPFDATNLDIEEFFQGCEVTNIRRVEDKLERKPKGFGYVEFKSVDGLKKALTLDGTQFRGRNIRISVAEPPKERQESREFNNWTRKGPLPDLPQQRRASERGGFNRGYEAAPEMERGGSRKGSTSFEGDGKVRDFNNWERKGPLSALPPPAGTPPVRDGGRVRDGPPKDRKLSPSWGPGEGRDGSRPPREQRERPHQEKQPTPADLDPQWRSRMRPDLPAKNSESPTPEASAPSSPAQPPPPAVRPKLNLQKRTVSEAEPVGPATASSDSKSSPFGAARPIDTAAREREIEEKMQLQLRLKKEADEKAREEKRQKDAAAKGTATEKATDPAEENDNAGDDPNENGNEAPAPGRNFQILSRVDDENTDAASEQGNQDEPANGEVAQEKAVKPREFIREPPKGPKAQQHREWRRKSSTQNTPASPGPSAKSLEEEGWSTVPTKNPRGRGRGRGGNHDNAGARAIAS